MSGALNGLRMSAEQAGTVRTARTLLHVNQPDGFDCPGCAWPEPNRQPGPGDHRPRFGGRVEFCENGVKAIGEEATLRRVTRAFFAEHSVADLQQKSDHWLGQQGRLTEPMFKDADSDHYRPISWGGALDLLAGQLQKLDDPDQAIFYTSGRTSNEAAFLYQLYARMLGTNNLPDCSNMCHESSGRALNETIGIGKGTVTIDDIGRADLIIIAGQNPGTNHPRMLTALENAKDGGAKIIAVNPLPEAGLIRFKDPQRLRGVLGRGVEIADEYAQLRVNGDLAFFAALGKLIIEADRQQGGVIDREFVGRHTAGFEEYVAALGRLDWDILLEATGLSRDQLEVIAGVAMQAKSIIVCWAMGLTQHKNAVASIREIVNFLLLGGHIGRPGAGPCPVRGHSNVQGDRTMGIWERMPADFHDRLDAEFAVTTPRRPGWDTVESIRAIRDGKAKVFVGMGGNFIRSTPDSDLVQQVIGNLDLSVQISTKLNRSHAYTGRTALILPTLGRTEIDLQASGSQLVTVEDSMGMVHASHGRLQPASDDLLSEVAIVCELGSRTFGPESPVDWAALRGDYARVRDHISRVVPGFEEFNDKITEPGGFALPNGPRDSRSFKTPDGKAHFTVNELQVLRPRDDELILQTVRSHDQYNTTIYGMDDRYRGIKAGRKVIFVHPADLDRLGFADGEIVDLVSRWESERGTQERRATAFRVVEYPTAAGCAAAYFPETNVLVPLDSTADGSNTPTSKSLLVRLERSPAGRDHQHDLP
jgi:molybdopterin-dependent oxidoreductase alpha subunit